VQRLDATAEHLGEGRDLLDPLHGHFAVLERARRPTGADERDAARVEAAGEVDEAGLVGDREQRTLDAQVLTPPSSAARA
jgi:hypothetical protein